MTEAARLSVVVEAKGVQQTSSAVGGLQRSLGGAAKTALKFTAAYAGIRAAGDALKFVVGQTVEFDRSMRNVNSLAKLSEGRFKSLEGSVLKLAGPTAQAPNTLAAGMYQLESSGFKAHDSLKILKASAIAATAGLTDTGTATTAVAGVLNAYHLSADQARQVSDDLFQTVNLGVLSFEQLAQGIGPVLPFASKLGVNLKQVGAAVSTLTKGGVPAAESFTYLKGVMAQMVKPSADLQGAFKKLGVSSGGELIKNTGSLQGALGALYKESGNNTQAFAKLFPDLRGLSAAFALTGKGAKGAKSDLANFAHDSGTASKVFKEQSKSVSVQWDRLKAQVSAGAIKIGSAVVPAMSGAVKGLTGFVTQMQAGTGAGGAFVSKIKEIGSTVGSVAGPIKDVALAFVKLATSTTGLRVLKDVAIALLSLKAASAVATGVKALARGLTGMVSPLGQLRTLAIVAGAAIALLSGHERSEADAAKAVASAKRDEADAIRAAQDAALAAADATFGAQQADIDLARAKDRLSTATDKYGKNSPQYRAGLRDERMAALRAVEAHKQLSDARHADTKASNDAVAASKKREAAAKDEIKTTLQNVTHFKSAAAFQSALSKGIKDYAAAQASATHAGNQRALQELQLQRLLSGGDLITNRNAASVAQLAAVYKQLPKSSETKINLLPQSALAAIGQVLAKLHGIDKAKATATILAKSDSATATVVAFKALLAGVPPKKVSNILAHTSGKPEIDALNAAIDRVHSKTVSVTTTTYQKTIQSVQRGAASSPGRGFGPQPGHKGKLGFRVVTPGSDFTDTVPGGASAMGGFAALKVTKTKGYNAITNKIEEHTAAQWRTIHAREAKSSAAKRRLAKRRQNYASPGELAISQSDVNVAAAGLTSGTGDDLKAEQGRLAALRKRRRELMHKLKGHLTKRQRVEVRGELAGIDNDIGSTAGTISDLNPHGMAMAQAGLAVNQAIGTPQQAIGSLTVIAGLWQKKLAAAIKAGDAAKITEAANGLKDASDQLKQASSDLQDAAATSNDASLVMAQVNTPASTSDDLAALQAASSTDKGFYDQAVAAGDTAGIIKWGTAYLGILDAIGNLTDTVAAGDNAQADFWKQIAQDAQRSANVANAQFPAFVHAISSHLGQSVLVGSTTPAAGKTGSL